MKPFAFSRSRNADASRATHKSHPIRYSATKPAENRYERRKMREFLRHNFDYEDASQFERFG